MTEVISPPQRSPQGDIITAPPIPVGAESNDNSAEISSAVMRVDKLWSAVMDEAVRANGVPEQPWQVAEARRRIATDPSTLWNLSQAGELQAAHLLESGEVSGSEALALRLVSAAPYLVHADRMMGRHIERDELNHYSGYVGGVNERLRQYGVMNGTEPVADALVAGMYDAYMLTANPRQTKAGGINQNELIKLERARAVIDSRVYGAQIETFGFQCIEAAGHSVKRADLELDAQGVDGIVDDMPVDMKSSGRGVSLKVNGVDGDEAWGVKNGVLVLHPMTSRGQLRGRFLVPEDEARQHGEYLTQILQAASHHPDMGSRDIKGVTT